MIRSLNDWIALRLSEAFSSMACFWLFLALALSPLVWPSTWRAVQFISSGVIQLVALPLLAVAARLIQAQQEQHQRDIADLHDKHDRLHAKHESLRALIESECDDGR